MADSKKYNGSTWEHSLRKLTTATDTITTLPADLYADGNNATVGLVGNMSQSGTPSPTAPIQPSECGNLTENIWNVTILPNSSITTENYWEKYDSSVVSTTMYMPCLPNTKYYLHTPSNIISGIFRVYTSTTDSIPGEGAVSVFVYEKIRSSEPISDFEFTTGTGARMLIIQVTTANSQTMADDAVLDNGFKIPILSGGTTTNVYLGEVQTTRKIKKLMLDGTDSYFWGHSTASTRSWSWFLMPQELGAATYIPFLCTHGAIVTNVSDYTYGTVYCDNTLNIGIFPDNLRDENEVRSWLANQAENGTPVIIWYVLAEPTTGIVNEPLRKIGDYADEVSNITIPVTAGANTLSVDTTLQPSEVTVNYKGWHPVADIHEKTAQLLNPANIIPDSMFNVNAIPSPAIEYSSTFNCSNYIPVTSGIYLRMLNNSAVGNYFFEFDSNKRYLRQKSPGEGRPMNISSDAAYVIFNIYKTYDIDKYMFARTAVPIPYEPYWT